jgi:hypothetical protein
MGAGMPGWIRKAVRSAVAAAALGGAAGSAAARTVSCSQVIAEANHIQSRPGVQRLDVMEMARDLKTEPAEVARCLRTYGRRFKPLPPGATDAERFEGRERGEPEEPAPEVERGFVGKQKRPPRPDLRYPHERPTPPVAGEADHHRQ